MEMRWGPKFWHVSVFLIKDGNYVIATSLQGCQQKRWTYSPSTWSWPPSRCLAPLTLDFSLPNASTYQNSGLNCIPMTWKRYLWFTDLIYRLKIDTWEDVHSVYLMLLIRTLAGMYIFVDEIITGQINDTAQEEKVCFYHFCCRSWFCSAIHVDRYTWLRWQFWSQKG